jgi:hypothetical protein
MQRSPAEARSLSEGDLVRSTNDLYKPYGIGRVQKMRNGMAKIEFNRVQLNLQHDCQATLDKGNG